MAKCGGVAVVHSRYQRPSLAQHLSARLQRPLCHEEAALLRVLRQLHRERLERGQYAAWTKLAMVLSQANRGRER